MIDDADNEETHEAGAVFDPAFKAMDRDLTYWQARLDQATEQLRSLRPIIKFIAEQGVMRAIEVFSLAKVAPVIDCLACQSYATSIATAAREEIEHLEWQAKGLDVKPLDDGD